MRFVTALAVGALLVVLPGSAQQPGDTLLIPAHAIDNSTGDQIADLTASDFVVSIDRHDRLVTSMEYVHPATHTFVAVIDQGTFSASSTPAAREAVTRLLDRVAPGDRVGLMAFPGSIAIAPATDRGPIRAGLGRIAGVLGEVPSEERGARSLDGLEAIIRAAAGQETFVLITAGAPVPGPARSQADLDNIAMRFARASAASDVTLYTLFMNTPFLTRFAAVRPPMALGDAMDTLGRSVYFAARGTGGTLYQLEVGADHFVGNLIKDASAYYRITIASMPPERDGKDHMISIGVNRPNVRVRAPASITIPKPSPGPDSLR